MPITFTVSPNSILFEWLTLVLDHESLCGFRYQGVRPNYVCFDRGFNVLSRFSITNVLWAFALAVVSISTTKAHADRYPNVIIVYADDLGYGDLSCYNTKAAYKTPRLDQMAAEGIRFLDAHSPSTICSPSRYGLFSGQQIYRSTGRGGGAFEGPGGPSYL